MQDTSECTTKDLLVWECPECGKLCKDFWHPDPDRRYGCYCGFIEDDINEYVIDIEWGD